MTTHKHHNSRYELIAAIINGELSGSATVQGAREADTTRVTIYNNLKRQNKLAKGMTVHKEFDAVENKVTITIAKWERNRDYGTERSER